MDSIDRETHMKTRKMNTREVSEYLGVNEKKIYSLISEKQLPATKITGKWIFFKDLVDAWLERSMETGEGFKPESSGLLLMTGSDDILFGHLLSILKKERKDLFPFFCKTGSLKGLNLLKEGKAQLACMHAFDEASNEYNLPFIDSHLQKERFVTVNFAKREQGLIVRKGNPRRIFTIVDIGGKGFRLINRQPGSGTRILLDMLLKKHGIPAGSIPGYEKEATTHLEIGLAVLGGEADCGIGIRTVANILDLDFIPLRKERFDIVIRKDSFFSREMSVFLEMVGSIRFKNRAAEFGGYDTGLSGKILYRS